MPKLLNRQVKWNYETNTGLLVTEYEENGQKGLLCEPITSEEAAQLEAEMNY